ncbi:MAG TPA: hypothetical protein VFW23_04205 [Tepidisphaeraceae bacterium]|nr:hypothetical protein [Tepidisphaeraceae bacterium]
MKREPQIVSSLGIRGTETNRFPKMRERVVRASDPGQRAAKTVLELGRSGQKTDSLLKKTDCLLVAVELMEEHAQQMVCIRIAWRCCHYVAITGFRLDKPARAMMRKSVA